ncbi:MAG TPA: PD-(D/E)XK nuclease family protein [Chthonomonadaceae bacterium]|nr:PD-(D/E)XK nuclease family protein [Chthonomonadaceae bacterium]
MRAIRKPNAGKKQERKPTLSPTRINTFLDCAVKYKYIYQDKIGRFYLRARAGYSFGSTLHHVLQQFHEGGEISSAEEMVSQVTENWIGAGYETEQQEQEHREAGERIVQAYHTAHQERAAAQVETLFTEKTITCDMGRFKLSGRVDRIDRHADGRLEILDYKSGRWETTPDEVANSLAMSCYQLILRKLYPDTPVFATIYCLRSGIQASFMLEGDQLEAFERDLLVLGHEILDTEYAELQPVPLAICEACDFLARCQRVWRDQERHEYPLEPFSEDGI